MKKLMCILLVALVCIPLFLNSCQKKADGKVSITIDSWRNDDVAIWEDIIIPAFNRSHPEIEVIFSATQSPEYNASLNARLEAGTAGDLITSRAFDVSLTLFQQGNLASLNGLEGLDNFPDVAKSAWMTDDGSDIFAVPMASVIHGFIYNADIFDELGLSPPETEAEFFALLDKIKADGRYVPLAMGTADLWDSATMGFQNIGPNYWKGETGRLNLIKGEEKFSDPQYVAVWETLARWAPYLSKGYQSQTYSDSQNLFTLGKAAIFPSGSWEISVFNEQADFPMGAFPPPVRNKGDQLYISDHTDIAMSMNPATPNPEAARKFLIWMTTSEFAELYSNALPGFFSLSNFDITLEDPLAQEFVNWRKTAELTIRNSYQILSRGEPNLENGLFNATAQVINGTLSPQEAGMQVQRDLDKWYKP